MFGPAAQVKRQAVAYLEPSSRRLPRAVKPSPTSKTKSRRLPRKRKAGDSSASNHAPTCTGHSCGQALRRLLPPGAVSGGRQTPLAAPWRSPRQRVAACRRGSTPYRWGVRAVAQRRRAAHSTCSDHESYGWCPR